MGLKVILMDPPKKNNLGSQKWSGIIHTQKKPPTHSMLAPTAVNSCQGTVQLCSNTQRPNHWKDPRQSTWHNSFLGSGAYGRPHGRMFETQPPRTLLLQFGAKSVVFFDTLMLERHISSIKTRECRRSFVSTLRSP